MKNIPWTILMLTLAFAACSGSSADKDAATKAAKVAVEATYTAELVRCVDKATTLAESKACRAQVDAKFGVDGGSDAGR